MLNNAVNKGFFAPFFILLVVILGGCARLQEDKRDANVGLGDLCSGEKECLSFCLDNHGRCEAYCKGNEIELCQLIFPPVQVARELAGDSPADAREQPCVSNPRPVFTAPFTDETKIREMSEIGSNAFYNPGSQVRSYVAVKSGELVPLYAPVNATLKRIVYNNKNYSTLMRPEYRLDLQVSCEVNIAFDHILSVVAKIEEQAPKIPSNKSSEGNYVEIPIKAGELLGHTSGTLQAGTWDFLLLNNAREAYHINPARWTTDHSKYADCPYDYFTDEIKKKYYALIPMVGSSPVTCGPAVRDVSDTIAGYWFQGNSSEMQGARFGVHGAKHFVEFILARDGEPFVFVRDANPSRDAPDTVTFGESACYYDDDKKVYAFLKLVSHEQLGLVTGTGRCPLNFPVEYEVFTR